MFVTMVTGPGSRTTKHESEVYVQKGKFAVKMPEESEPGFDTFHPSYDPCKHCVIATGSTNCTLRVQ